MYSAIILIFIAGTAFAANNTLPIDKRDQVLAYVFNYGDPEREYPTITKITKACNMKWKNGLRDMMDDLIGVIEDYYERNEVVVRSAEIMFSNSLIPDDECKKVKGPNTRALGSQTKEFNEHRFGAKNYRELLENILADATREGTDLKLPQIVCYIKLWIDKTLTKYPTKNGIRKRAKMDIHRTLDELLKYLDSLSEEKVAKCDFRDTLEHPDNVPRFKSLQLNILDAIYYLNKKSKN